MRVRKEIAALARIVGASSASALLAGVSIAVSNGNMLVVPLAILASLWLWFEHLPR